MFIPDVPELREGRRGVDNKPKCVAVVYFGLFPDFDDKLIEFMKSLGYHVWAMGRDVREDRRDIQFDLDL